MSKTDEHDHDLTAGNVGRRRSFFPSAMLLVSLLAALPIPRDSAAVPAFSRAGISFRRRCQRRPVGPPRRSVIVPSDSRVSDGENEAPAAATTTTSPQQRLFDRCAKLPPPTFLSSSFGPRTRPPAEGGAGLFALDDIGPDVELARLPAAEFRFDADAALRVLCKEDSDGGGRGGVGPVASKLLELASEEGTTRGRRMAAVAGALAHLHLLRLEGKRSGRLGGGDEGGGALLRYVEERFGPFLDVLPLVPSASNTDGRNGRRRDPHPFPTHVLCWSDDEVSNLLLGTIAASRARMIRASAGELLGVLSAPFLSEHFSGGSPPLVTAEEIKDSIVSSFAAVLSRGFADAGDGEVIGSDAGGRGMLVPILDFLNHSPWFNVAWTVDESSGLATLRTTRGVEKGEELLANYGGRPSWDFGAEYGFVPDPQFPGTVDPTEAAGVPLFPPSVELDAGGVEDLLAGREKLGDIVRSAVGAVSSSSAPRMLPLFRPAEGGAKGEDFPPMQPCVVLSAGGIEAALPVFCASAAALSAVAAGRSASAEELEAAAAPRARSAVAEDANALELILGGIDDRIRMLQSGGKWAREWASSSTLSPGDGSGSGSRTAHVAERLDMSGRMRDAELSILRVLRTEVLELIVR